MVRDSPETVAARKSVLSRQIELDQQAATLRADKAKLAAREADLAERLQDLAERESKVCPAALRVLHDLHSAASRWPRMYHSWQDTSLKFVGTPCPCPAQLACHALAVPIRMAQRLWYWCFAAEVAA
jgi:hypothetical protein